MLSLNIAKTQCKCRSSFFHMVILITGSCYFRVSTLFSNSNIMYIHYREFRIIEMSRDKKKSFIILPSRNKHCCSFDTFSSSPYFPMHNFYCIYTSDFLIYHYSTFNPASLEILKHWYTDSLIVHYIVLAWYLNYIPLFYIDT